MLAHLAQGFTSPVILCLPPLEEGALVILTHGLLLLGCVELLRGDLLRSTLVGNHPLLHLLSCPALTRQERICKHRYVLVVFDERPHPS